MFPFYTPSEGLEQLGQYGPVNVYGCCLAMGDVWQGVCMGMCMHVVWRHGEGRGYSNKHSSMHSCFVRLSPTTYLPPDESCRVASWVRVHRRSGEETRRLTTDQPSALCPSSEELHSRLRTDAGAVPFGWSFRLGAVGFFSGM